MTALAGELAEQWRSVLALAASALAGLAAVIASLDGDADIVPFFVALTLGGAVAGWATQPPFAGVRRTLARAIAFAWLVAAGWVGVLFAMSFTVWAGSGPPPAPETTYLGLTATIYHLGGLYAGLPLIWAAAFAPDRRRGE
jgi:hypothetical protein